MASPIMMAEPLNNHEVPRPDRIAENLERPALDDRSYRVIRLENQLEALLIHDPDTDKVSGALDVNVGSFSDADDMPGIAHAVEHLLFMGTEKVSQEQPIRRAVVLRANVLPSSVQSDLHSFVAHCMHLCLSIHLSISIRMEVNSVAICSTQKKTRIINILRRTLAIPMRSPQLPQQITTLKSPHPQHLQVAKHHLQAAPKKIYHL
jgi:hypothetical protein